MLPPAAPAAPLQEEPPARGFNPAPLSFGGGGRGVKRGC
jgi:hypothetical protein